MDGLRDETKSADEGAEQEPQVVPTQVGCDGGVAAEVTATTKDNAASLRPTRQSCYQE